MKTRIYHLLSLSLLSVLVFNPYGSNLFELPKLSFITVLLAIILTVLVIASFRKTYFEVRYNKAVYLFFGLWVTSLVVSTVFSEAPLMSFWGTYSRLQGFYSHLIYLSYFLLFLHFLVDEESQKFFLKFLMWIGVFASVHAILQQFGIGIFSIYSMQEFLNRSFATLGHPSFLGQFLLFPIWATVYLLIKEKRKYIYGVAMILLLTGLFLSANRASILGLCIALIVFLITKINIKNIYKYLLSGMIVAGFISFIFFMAPSMRSLDTRLILWENAVKLIPDHPIIGSGIETFESMFQKVTSPKFFELEQMYSLADRSHNELLDIFVMQGGFGLIIYLTIFCGVFYLILKNKNSEKGEINLILGLTLLSVIISEFFSFPLVVENLLIMATLAMILNNLFDFKNIKISNNPVVTFVFGILIALNVLLVGHSVNALKADKNYFDGMNYLYSHKVTDGINTMIDAVNQNIYQGDIHFQLGEIFYVIGKETRNMEMISLAINAIESAGKFTNKNFRYHFAKAQIATSGEDYDSAENEYMQAQKLAPINPIISKEMAVMYYEKGDYKKTIEQMEKFLSLMPAYWKEKDAKETHRLFFKHIPDFWDIFDYISMSYAHIGNKEKALYYIQFVQTEESKAKIQKEIDKIKG